MRDESRAHVEMVQILATEIVAQVTNEVSTTVHAKGHRYVKTTMRPMTVMSLTTSSEAMSAVETKEVKQNKSLMERVCHEGKLNKLGKLDHLPLKVHVKRD